MQSATLLNTIGGFADRGGKEEVGRYDYRHGVFAGVGVNEEGLAYNYQFSVRLQV